MVETITFSLIDREDLDIGHGDRSVRLQDGSLHTLTRLNLGTLAILETVRRVATAGAGSLTITFNNPAGSRIQGVTIKITTALGTTNGLTSIDIGDARTQQLWGDNVGITLNTETSSDNFFVVQEPLDLGSYPVIITANGGNFDGVGEIEVQLHYSRLRHVSP